MIVPPRGSQARQRVNLEQPIVKAILEWLALVKIPAWRQNTGAIRAEYKGKERFIRYGIVGGSDILGIVPHWGPSPGRWIAIEVKRPGREPTPTKRAFLEMIRTNGGIAMSVHSLQECIVLMDVAGLT